MYGQLQVLLESAMRAPSGDNTQPWRFGVDVDQRVIRLFIDSARDPSPMNAGQRMARIALGTALENMVQTAQHNGWAYDLRDGRGEELAQFVLLNSSEDLGEADGMVMARVTNRRVYEPYTLNKEELRVLEDRTPELFDTRTYWVVDGAQIASLTSLISRADAMMFGLNEVRAAFLSKVRFDQPVTAQVDDGLSLGTLELSPFNRAGLRMMSRTPNWLLKLGGAKRIFADAAKKLAGSAAGLCLIASTGAPSPKADMTVGRAMERAWLALTAADMAVQPMMSLLVLQNIRDNGSEVLRTALRRQQVDSLLEEFYQYAGRLGGGQPSALLRFGRAPAPTTRTGRLSLQAVVKPMPLASKV